MSWESIARRRSRAKYSSKRSFGSVTVCSCHELLPKANELSFSAADLSFYVMGGGPAHLADVSEGVTPLYPQTGDEGSPDTAIGSLFSPAFTRDAPPRTQLVILRSPDFGHATKNLSVVSKERFFGPAHECKPSE